MAARCSYEGEERSRELDKPRGSFSIDRVEQLREVGLAYEVELLRRSSLEASSPLFTLTNNVQF